MTLVPVAKNTHVLGIGDVGTTIALLGGTGAGTIKVVIPGDFVEKLTGDVTDGSFVTVMFRLDTDRLVSFEPGDPLRHSRASYPYLVYLTGGLRFMDGRNGATLEPATVSGMNRTLALNMFNTYAHLVG